VGESKKKMQENIHLIIAILVSLFIAIGDVLTPLGYVVWIIYLIPLFMVIRLKKRKYSIFMTFLVIVLIATGYFFSPLGVQTTIVTANRILGIITIAFFSYYITNLISKSELQSIALLESNKQLEQFAHTISHDLRNPVKSLQGMADILIEDDSSLLDIHVIDLLKRIKRVTNTMNSLIDDILDLSKVSYMGLQRTNVGLGKIVSEIISDLQRQEPSRDVMVTIGNNLNARADERLIRIALTNLVNNAWKYTSKKDKAIIEFGKIQRNHKTIFFIRDNGAGFNMNYAKTMFEPFKRLHNEKEFQGTGIGLATVDRIIKRHTGTIWGEGEVEKGATFYFTLPH
jgi:light-regulated signal transduction histidine kinase (bacteriophytochrome)